MKIQSIIRRAKGTTVGLGDKVYFFSPDLDHTCDVTDEVHIKRFLSIKEGFREAVGDDSAKVAQKSSESVKQEGIYPVALHGTSVHPSEFEIKGRTYTLGEIVAKAHAATGLSVEDWNSIPEGERADLIDAELDKLAADGEDNRDELIAAYVAKFGKKPHHAMKTETIAAKLADAGKNEG